jgi:hypothetical protein
MSTKKIIALGCGIVTLIGVLLVTLVVLFVAHVAQDPKDMSIAVDAPATVTNGQDLLLVVQVINDRSKDALTVDTIDIGEEYLKGFIVMSCEPAFDSSTRIPIDESRSYEFKTRIPPGGTNRFSFKLQARETGHFSGEIDVCEGMRFLTMVVETQVE